MYQRPSLGIIIQERSGLVYQAREALRTNQEWLLELYDRLCATKPVAEEREREFLRTYPEQVDVRAATPGLELQRAWSTIEQVRQGRPINPLEVSTACAAVSWEFKETERLH